jgi:hypothetical protein
VFVFNQQAMNELDTYTLRATTGGWDLRLNGERLSLFETFCEAERTALSAAEASRHHGKVVEVYVQTASGTINLLPLALRQLLPLALRLGSDQGPRRQQDPRHT